MFALLLSPLGKMAAAAIMVFVLVTGAYVKGRTDCAAISRVRALEEKLAFVAEERDRQQNISAQANLRAEQAIKSKREFDRSLRILNKEDSGNVHVCIIDDSYFERLFSNRLR